MGNEYQMANYNNGACSATLSKQEDGKFIVRLKYKGEDVGQKIFCSVVKASDYAVDHIAIK